MTCRCLGRVANREGHRTISQVPTAFATKTLSAWVIGFPFAQGHNCNRMNPDEQLLTGMQDRLCIMKEALSRSLQNSIFDLSEQIVQRPKNKDEVDLWLERVGTALGGCNREYAVFKSHKDFHGC